MILELTTSLYLKKRMLQSGYGYDIDRLISCGFAAWASSITEESVLDGGIVVGVYTTVVC